MRLKYFTIVFIIVAAFFSFTTVTNSHQAFETSFASDRKMEVGEDLTYVVKFSFIKLGEVRLRVVDKKEMNGITYYKTICYIDSYSGIPFVSVHQIFESNYNSNHYSNFFRGIVRYDDYSTYTEYYFNYSKNKIRLTRGKVQPREVWFDSTTTADKKYQDGLSIFYYARMNFGEVKSVNVPCYVNEEKVNTRINFYNTPEPVSISSINYDVSCLKLDGKTDFVSVYGLTGNFEGWFSNDEASIPIIAKMHLFVGNVSLELKSWRRNGWNPPKFKK